MGASYQHMQGTPTGAVEAWLAAFTAQPGDAFVNQVIEAYVGYCTLGYPEMPMEDFVLWLAEQHDPGLIMATFAANTVPWILLTSPN